MFGFGLVLGIIKSQIPINIGLNFVIVPPIVIPLGTVVSVTTSFATAKKDIGTSETEIEDEDSGLEGDLAVTTSTGTKSVLTQRRGKQINLTTRCSFVMMQQFLGGADNATSMIQLGVSIYSLVDTLLTIAYQKIDSPVILVYEGGIVGLTKDLFLQNFSSKKSEDSSIIEFNLLFSKEKPEEDDGETSGEASDQKTVDDTNDFVSGAS